MDVDDFIFDDIMNVEKKKKKINSGSKGKRGERWLVNLFNARFVDILSKNPTWGEFSRSIGSGNRSGQNVKLSAIAGLVFTSDLTCPPTFKFSIESKSGYNQIDLNSIFDGGNKELDTFIIQVSNDAKKIDKEPLLIWKKDRRPALAFFHDKENLFSKSEYKMNYREWTVININELMLLPDEYFFL